MVKDFHTLFSVETNKRPSLVSKKTVELRRALIQEELDEYVKAATGGDLVGVGDALADLLYVVYGTAVTHGIDTEPLFKEVHDSNMSKGQPKIVRAPNGKVLKGKHFRAPDLKPLIEAQLAK